MKKDPKAQVFPVACPLFVPLVEEGYVDHPATRLIVQEYLSTLKEHKVDTLLLGCTHYPLLKDLISHEMGGEVAIIDSAASCANMVAKLLSSSGLHNVKKTKSVFRYFVSDDAIKFQKLGSAFLGMPIHTVALV